MGWDGMGWDGTGRDGMGWDGMGWDGMGLDGMGWDEMREDLPLVWRKERLLQLLLESPFVLLEPKQPCVDKIISHRQPVVCRAPLLRFFWIVQTVWIICFGCGLRSLQGVIELLVKSFR